MEMISYVEKYSNIHIKGVAIKDQKKEDIYNFRIK